MDRKTALFVATIGSVAVIVSLALTVTLWPERQKADSKGGAGSNGTSSGARGTSDMATAQPVNRKPHTPASAPSSLGLTDLSGANVVGAPIIKQEIGQAYVRDPETGQMKEVPFTAQVLIMTGPDGKPLQVKDAKVQGFVAATESSGAGSNSSGGHPLGGTTSRPK
jgi:hypothetical protein